MNNLIIGIAGGSGSGKTTLAYRLKERFGEDEVRLISHDSYYKRHDELPFAERCKLNYDHPDAFDNDLLIQHLKELKAGRAIDCPVYDYANHMIPKRGGSRPGTTPFYDSADPAQTLQLSPLQWSQSSSSLPTMGSGSMP